MVSKPATDFYFTRQKSGITRSEVRARAPARSRNGDDCATCCASLPVYTLHPLFLLLRVWITTAWSSGYIHYKNVGLRQQFALLPARRSFDFQSGYSVTTLPYIFFPWIPAVGFLIKETTPGQTLDCAGKPIYFLGNVRIIAFFSELFSGPYYSSRPVIQ